ncbi:MAG: hypothetical protein ACMXX5_01015 [Candidatus Woesearchaeota archaeon]
MGVTMLLLFIGSIIATTIAAAALILTIGIVQERRDFKFETGSTEVTAIGLEVVNIYARGNVSAQTINDFEILLRLRQGSNPFLLSTLKLTLSSGNFKSSASLNERISGNECIFSSLSHGGEYCIQKTIGEQNHVLNENELVTIRYRLNNQDAIRSNQRFNIALQPRQGSVISFNLNSPENIVSTSIRLK